MSKKRENILDLFLMGLDMTPDEFKSNALCKLDSASDSLYKRLLEKSQDSLKHYPSRSVPKYLKIEILSETDETFQEEVLDIACKRLVKHYKSIGWQAKIEVDFDPFFIYKTPSHILHLTYTTSPLVKFWYNVSGSY